MNSSTTSATSLAAAAPGPRPRPVHQRRTPGDWLYAVLLAVAAVWGWRRFGPSMDAYEQAIWLVAIPALIALGWFWAPVRILVLSSVLATAAAIALYQGGPSGHAVDLGRGERVFGLKYFLSSQSAILWMSVLLFMSTIFYWLGVISRGSSAARMGSRLAWVGVFMAITGSLVRWWESYQMGADVGHIPVSNLYEVFVLFAWMTTAFWLYYEDRFEAIGRPIAAVGAFAMLVVSAAVGFLLWYALVRGASEIQPLVPALQSWWMKLHVPANFIGYGTFSLSAMVAFAYLVKQHAAHGGVAKLVPLWLLGVVLCFEPLVFRGKSATQAVGDYWLVYFGISALIVGAILAARRRIAAQLPALDVLDDLMYKAIAVGFAFFTIATILGAFWAAQAWGGYWSWDPKETWALIVWLNYAAWLHMRLIKGLRGAWSAWWALGGLVVTSFAFLGVNMFLSGLHSYGQL